MQVGDTILADHLATTARNATYTSSGILEIISILADQIRHLINNKVKVAWWFTVIADEVTDAANNLRYVDPDNALVRDDLVGFFECDTGITGRDLADKITSSLCAYGLDLTNLRGQAYEGAGSMAGLVNGAAVLIRAQYPLALFLHCTSHWLNLAVVNSVQVTSVCNMMGVGGRVYQLLLLILSNKGL